MRYLKISKKVVNFVHYYSHFTYIYNIFIYIYIYIYKGYTYTL